MGGLDVNFLLSRSCNFLLYVNSLAMIYIFIEGPGNLKQSCLSEYDPHQHTPPCNTVQDYYTGDDSTLQDSDRLKLKSVAYFLDIIPHHIFMIRGMGGGGNNKLSLYLYL